MRRGNFPNDLRKIVKHLRQERGLSIAEICRETGVPESTFKSWLSNAQWGRIPTISQFLYFCKFARITPNYFLDDNPNKSIDDYGLYTPSTQQPVLDTLITTYKTNPCDTTLHAIGGLVIGSLSKLNIIGKTDFTTQGVILELLEPFEQFVIIIEEQHCEVTVSFYLNGIKNKQFDILSDHFLNQLIETFKLKLK